MESFKKKFDVRFTSDYLVHYQKDDGWFGSFFVNHFPIIGISGHGIEGHVILRFPFRIFV
ncbi:hypothetical protein DQG13_04465 [Paenibacillus sp. YN15]|nr:hypothetical protein DQG13_04465 [Paenibacillus sp. YN15]